MKGGWEVGGGGRICLWDCSNMRAREAKKEKESVCFATFDVRRAAPGTPPRSSDEAGPLGEARSRGEALSEGSVNTSGRWRGVWGGAVQSGASRLEHRSDTFARTKN